MSQPPQHDADTARKDWMGIFARARPERMAAALPDPLPAHVVIRSPEIGSVMVRGRIGGTGGPFNLGEMTVTRCSIRLSGGETGHGYVQGRSKDHALRAAVADALMQTGAADDLTRALIEPLRREEEERRAARAARAAATKVEFFTMARGEDA